MMPSLFFRLVLRIVLFLILIPLPFVLLPRHVQAQMRSVPSPRVSLSERTSL